MTREIPFECSDFTDIWSWPRKLRKPTLLVRGGVSEVLSSETCKSFCRLYPQAQTAVVEGAGHFIPMQRPDETIRLVKDFYRPKTRSTSSDSASSL